MSGRDDSQIVTHFRVVLHFVCPPGRTQTTSGDEGEASKLARRYHAAASSRRSARPLPPEAGLGINKPRLTDTKACQACLKIHKREVFRPLPNYALPVCSFQVIKAFPWQPARAPRCCPSRSPPGPALPRGSEQPRLAPAPLCDHSPVPCGSGPSPCTCDAGGPLPSASSPGDSRSTSWHI